MKRIMIIPLLSCFVVILLLSACKSGPRIYNHSKALIISKDAEDAFYDLRDGGSIQLGFKLKEDSPAT
jgi:hypothetical protein